MNQVLLTLAQKNGNTVSLQSQFDPSKMLDIRQTGAAVTFNYPSSGDDGEYDSYKTGALTLAQLNSASNTTSPGGGLEFIGRINSTTGFSVGVHDFLDENGNPIYIPDNARVWSGFYEVITTFTSPTSDAASISFDIETDDVAGLKAATTIATGTTYDATGAPVLIIPQSSVATVSEKTTGIRKLQYTVGVEAITAGSLILWVKVVAEGL